MEQLSEAPPARVQDIDLPGARPYRIRPLRGQVLVRLLPHDLTTTGGLHLPDVAILAASGEKEFPRKAVVLAVGEWRKTKQGFHILPDFHIGQRVLVSEYDGTKLTRNIGEEFRLVKVDDVLAIVETELKAVDGTPSEA